MLNEIEEYIQRQNLVSLDQLCVHFNIDETALLPILVLLESQQRIEQIDPMDCGQQCHDCETVVYYQVPRSVK